MKLIEQNTIKEIGEINLEFIPRKTEALKFENKLFTIHNVIYSEENIILRVFENEYEINEILS